MAEAEVGDDVFRGDPTVNYLQDRVAELFGKEAALFSPSGTMANQIVFKTIAQPGWDLVCERECHIANYEVAGPAQHAGLLVTFLDSERGFFTAEQLRGAIRPINEHCPLTKIVELENTHNRHGGAVCSIGQIAELSAVCRERELHFHLDGARIWNAHVASGVALADYARYFDTVSVCLSKGLGAPLGSLTLGDKDFIERARRIRKMFGGGMRQVGIVAAAGLYALENNLQKLAVDHENARALAEGLNELSGITVDLSRVETNIVIADLDADFFTPDEFYERALEQGVWCVPFGARRVRFVTHLDISATDIRTALERLSRLSA
ncbi:MAG TPA: GntG family PLP-dependent aldolase, partial [candidate division Zixibacteria bacterium]|nr:GntG family PLP-dependent aldolase [candidate division Zixibacteria bacterium]